jgi:hypothetical protein
MGTLSTGLAGCRLFDRGDSQQAELDRASETAWKKAEDILVYRNFPNAISESLILERQPMA